MSATSVTLRGRVAAERNMVDTCDIKRITSQATDPTTAVVTPTYSTLYAAQRCLFQVESPSPADVGEAHLVLLQFTIHLPMSVTDVRETDVVFVTASALDPDLVGRVFRIGGPQRKTYLTARRLPCIEITS